MNTSVRDLQIGEMISISTMWIGAQKTTFQAIPEIAPHFARVETVHHSLIDARDGASADATLADLTAQAEVLDDRHDHLLRGFHFLMLAARSFELGHDGGDSAKAKSIVRASKALLPDQLRAVQASYQAEAGNAQQLETLASNEFATLLGSIHITKDTTALDMTHEIGTVGKALGNVEHQRSLAAAQLEKDAMTRGEVRRRMREWARVAEAILTNLDIASAPVAQIDAIRQPLLDAVDKALARIKSQVQP